MKLPHRRRFLHLAAGAAALPAISPFAWAQTYPTRPRAQHEQMRRIGILLDASADDVYYRSWVAAFHQALAVLGWTIDRNVRVDTRWAAGEAERVRKYASELVALAPDV